MVGGQDVAYFKGIAKYVEDVLSLSTVYHIILSVTWTLFRLYTRIKICWLRISIIYCRPVSGPCEEEVSHHQLSLLFEGCLFFFNKSCSFGSNFSSFKKYFRHFPLWFFHCWVFYCIDSREMTRYFWMCWIQSTSYILSLVEAGVMKCLWQYLGWWRYQQRFYDPNYLSGVHVTLKDRVVGSLYFFLSFYKFYSKGDNSRATANHKNRSSNRCSPHNETAQKELMFLSCSFSLRHYMANLAPHIDHTHREGLLQLCSPYAVYLSSPPPLLRQRLCIPRLP